MEKDPVKNPLDASNDPQITPPVNPFMVAASATKPVENPMDMSMTPTDPQLVGAEASPYIFPEEEQAGSLPTGGLELSVGNEVTPGLQFGPGHGLPQNFQAQKPAGGDKVKEAIDEGGGGGQLWDEAELTPNDFLNASRYAEMSYTPPDVSQLSTMDYYPTLQRPIVQGMFQGEEGFSAPIYAAGGFLPPMKVMDARQQALRKAKERDSLDIQPIDTYDIYENEINKNYFSSVKKFIDLVKPLGPAGIRMLKDPTTDIGMQYLQMNQFYNTLGTTLTEAETMIKDIKTAQIENDAYLGSGAKAAINKFENGVSAFDDNIFADPQEVYDSMKEIRGFYNYASTWNNYIDKINFEVTSSKIEDTIREYKKVNGDRLYPEFVHKTINNTVDGLVKDFIDTNDQDLLRTLYGNDRQDVIDGVKNRFLSFFPDDIQHDFQMAYKTTDINVSASVDTKEDMKGPYSGSSWMYSQEIAPTLLGGGPEGWGGGEKSVEKWMDGVIANTTYGPGGETNIWTKPDYSRIATTPKNYAAGEVEGHWRDIGITKKAPIAWAMAREGASAQTGKLNVAQYVDYIHIGDYYDVKYKDANGKTVVIGGTSPISNEFDRSKNRIKEKAFKKKDYSSRITDSYLLYSAVIGGKRQSIDYRLTGLPADTELEFTGKKGEIHTITVGKLFGKEGYGEAIVEDSRLVATSGVDLKDDLGLTFVDKETVDIASQTGDVLYYLVPISAIEESSMDGTAKLGWNERRRTQARGGQKSVKRGYGDSGGGSSPAPEEEPDFDFDNPGGK